MQTFLCEHTFSGTAEYLDKRRLNKQFIEARQILDVLLEKTNARWRNHPAVLMWKGYERALYMYTMRMKEELVIRGVSIEKNEKALTRLYNLYLADREIITPNWWQDDELKERIVISHRARLCIKDPVYYASYKPYVCLASHVKCCPHCNYFWPSHHARNLKNRVSL
jgi:hypothetical protein